MQTSKILSLVVLISLSFCVPRSLCTAQKKIPPVDHDYYVLAMSSIADIAAEASKQFDSEDSELLALRLCRVQCRSARAQL